MSFQMSEAGLHVPSNYTKARPPKTGPAYGAWSGPNADLIRYELPGGALLQFDLSKLTLADYRSMRDHYQINISLSILAFTMHQLDWWVECDDTRIETFVTENLTKLWTRLIRGVSQAYWAGFSPMVLEYENDLLGRKIEVNKIKDLTPEECRVNWKKVDGYAPPGHAKPARYIFDGIKQDRSSAPIPVENSLWYPCLMENGNFSGRKLLRPAFAPYFFSQIIHLYSNRYFERFGEPVVVGRAPLDDEVDMGNGQFKSGREVMEGIVTGLRNQAAVVLPADRTPTGRGDQHDFEYTIDYLESQMRGADFERYLQRLDEEMSLSMFLPVLLFRTADVGSYSLGQAHERLFFFMMNALAGDLAEYLDRFLLSRMVDFNFSEKAPRARFRWRKLGKDTDETIRSMLQASIQAGTLKPDVDELGMAAGMTLHEVSQVTRTESGTSTGDGGVGPDGQALPGDTSSTSITTVGLTTATKQVVNDIVKRLRGQARKAERSEGGLASMDAQLGYRKKMELAVRHGHATQRVRVLPGHGAHIRRDEPLDAGSRQALCPCRRVR